MKEKKVLLVNLPWRGTKYAVRAGVRWAHTFDKESVVSFRPFPFIMACAAALLEKKGHSVKVIDALAESMSEQEFYREIAEFRPDFIVAETSTPSYSNDIYFVSQLKKRGNGKIVLTGQHATAMPDEIAKENKEVDHVLVGEYEYLLLNLVEGKAKGRVIRPKKLVDIDTIPWPARHMFKMSLYNEAFCRAYPNMQFMFSRGCYYRCSYCNTHLMCNGYNYRARDAKDMLAEIKFCIARYHPKELYFDDDLINGDLKALEAFLDLKIKEDVRIPFTAMAHLNFPEALLEKAKRAGCVGLKFGVESASNDVLRKLGKGITTELAVRTITKCKKLGIRTHLTYAIGLPGDTEETIKATIKFARKYGDHYQISLASPFPGTELYKMAEQNGWLRVKSLQDYNGLNNATIDYPNLPSKKILALYKEGQSNSYRKILVSGEWKKYLRMIYKERGMPGILKLVFLRGPSIAWEIVKSR
jgi:anaerobic magnesium-protoporphyrin IX monomethyl ester cyclase